MMPDRGKPRVPESLDGSMNFSVKTYIVKFDKGPIWNHSRLFTVFPDLNIPFLGSVRTLVLCGFAEITLHSKPEPRHAFIEN